MRLVIELEFLKEKPIKIKRRLMNSIRTQDEKKSEENIKKIKIVKYKNK